MQDRTSAESATSRHTPSQGRDPVIDPFVEHRRLLFGTAYQMLGTVTDAEDILQDAWLKWHGVDQDSIEYPKSYLVRTVTNLALNRLTSARATRETYVGPWLPEPLLTPSADAAEETELAETVSTAMLVVLETLTPVERAVFVLREVFGYSHAEIAGFLDRPEATVRQISHRARSHVQSRRPLHGPDHVARWMLGVMAKPVSAGIRLESAVINGELGILGKIGDYTLGALTFDLVDGRIEHLRFQVNPDKLGRLNRPGEDPA
ncbi:sigma-70 family RNA polymerase sigma factor [Nocardia sp. NPDC055321]